MSRPSLGGTAAFSGKLSSPTIEYVAVSLNRFHVGLSLRVASVCSRIEAALVLGQYILLDSFPALTPSSNQALYLRASDIRSTFFDCALRARNLTRARTDNNPTPFFPMAKQGT